MSDREKLKCTIMTISAFDFMKYLKTFIIISTPDLPLWGKLGAMYV